MSLAFLWAAMVLSFLTLFLTPSLTDRVCLILGLMCLATTLAEELASPPPVLARGVVPVLDLSLDPAVIVPALSVVSTVLALFPHLALALGVVPFLVWTLALNLLLAGLPASLVLGYSEGLPISLFVCAPALFLCLCVGLESLLGLGPSPGLGFGLPCTGL